MSLEGAGDTLGETLGEDPLGLLGEDSTPSVTRFKLLITWRRRRGGRQ